MSKTTHVVAILDCSGSMGSLQEEVISNFNKFLKEQQAVKGKAKLTLVTFDDQYNLVYDKVKLKDVEPITNNEYIIGGMTALNDAVGKTVSKMINKKKVILFIHTDGAENSSQEYTAEQVQALVKSKEDEWEVMFVGAGIDAQTTGSNLGFQVTDCFSTTRTADDLQVSYASFSANTVAYRTA